jgi:hypothetical protein
MFKMCQVRFQAVYALGVYLCHAWILPLSSSKVEQCVPLGFRLSGGVLNVFSVPRPSASYPALKPRRSRSAPKNMAPVAIT